MSDESAAEQPAGDGLVQVAYLHPHKVSYSWHESMTRLVMWDLAHDGRVTSTKGPLAVRAETGGLVEARNLAFKHWLDETPHEWLLFVDTDMGFQHDALDRLLDAADPVDRPVVGALCFALREVSYDGYGGRRVTPVPTIFGLGRDETGQVGFRNRWKYPDNTVLQVAGTGAAFLLVHRSAAEKVRAESGAGWFERVRYQDGRWISEDLSFCWRLGRVGVPIFVHTGVKTTHHKQCWIGADDYTQPEVEPVQADVPAGVQVSTPPEARAGRARPIDPPLNEAEVVALMDQEPAEREPELTTTTAGVTGVDVLPGHRGLPPAVTP